MAKATLYSGIGIPNYLPLIKRATGRLTDGRSVTMFMSTNAQPEGGDMTGVAKILIWVSNDSFRNDFGLDRPVNPNEPLELSDTPMVSYTPPAAPCSPTVQGVASMCVGTDNSIWIAWADVNGALHCTKWVYTPGAAGAKGTIGAATDQVVSAANGVTKRFRYMDMDIAGANNPIIACYEALASNWVGAEVRIYIRNADNVTWRRAVAWGLIGQNQIQPKSEDVSIQWHADGIVSNVGKFLLFMTATATTFDNGDTIREYQYNVSTGTDGSATQRGDWFGFGFGKSLLHVNQNGGQRRAWIFKLNTGPQGMWLVAGVNGSSVPKFWATKLTTGNWTPPLISVYQPSTIVALANNMRIDASNDMRLATSCQYADNRLVWGFLGYSRTNYEGIFREVMFRYNSVLEYPYSFVDTIPRPLDGDGEGPYSLKRPTAIYGADASRANVSPGQFNWLLAYPIDPTHNTSKSGIIKHVAEDVPGTVRLVYPTWANDQYNNRPTFKVGIDPDDVPPSHYAKVEIQVASDSAFTQNLRSAIEPNKAYAYYGPIEGRQVGERIVTIPGTLLNLPLFTGSWFWRARLVTDKGQVGPWVATDSDNAFSVIHPPVAAPVTPKPNSIISWGASGNVSFTWNTIDTEPTDSQAAYNVVISRVDDGTVVLDTQWVSSAATSVVLNIPVAQRDILLKWKVRARDIDGSEGNFSPEVVFTAGLIPDVSFTSPSGGTAILNANSDFETDVASWTMTGGTLARDTSITQSGTGSALMTATGGTAQIMESEKVPVTLGMAYYARAWVRAEVAQALGTGARLMIIWYAQNDSVISSVTLQESALAAGTWVQLSGTSVVPDGATKAALRAMQLGAPAANTQVRVDTAEFKVNTVTTATPTFQWSFTGYGARTQAAFRLVVTDVITGIVVGDSLWQMSNATQFTFPGQILIDHGKYSVLLQVQDTGGLRDDTTVTFQTDWINPVQPATVNLAQDGFKTTITWSNTQGTQESPGGDVDPGFVAWRVWRRYRKPALAEMDFEGTAIYWEMIAELYDPTINQFKDYQAPLNKPTDYAVTQIAERFGSVIDSDITSWQTITCVGDRYYFVPEDLVGTIASYQASYVTADSFTDEVEQETIHVIGRGRQVQVGDDLGYAGSLTIQLRNPATARADREFLEYLSSSKTNNVYIRSPFGDVLLVKLGSLSFDRQAGVGAINTSGNIADIGNLTVPYSEVIGNKVKITRADSGN